MEMMPLKPERKAQLEEYARRRGQDLVTALDMRLRPYLDWERRDFAEAAERSGAGTKMLRPDVHILPRKFSLLFAGNMVRVM